MSYDLPSSARQPASSSLGAHPSRGNHGLLLAGRATHRRGVRHRPSDRPGAHVVGALPPPSRRPQGSPAAGASLTQGQAHKSVVRSATRTTSLADQRPTIPPSLRRGWVSRTVVLHEQIHTRDVLGRPALASPEGPYRARPSPAPGGRPSHPDRDADRLCSPARRRDARPGPELRVGCRRRGLRPGRDRRPPRALRHPRLSPRQGRGMVRKGPLQILSLL